jgi:hypothetical protein
MEKGSGRSEGARPPKPADDRAENERRLAEALRANLRRRKQAKASGKP